jgi:putative nucleotidyltransferase with HDIG domain
VNRENQAIRRSRELLSNYPSELDAQAPRPLDPEAAAARDRGWLLLVNHSLRVEALAVEVARKTPAFAAGDLPLLRVAAIFHDIGSAFGRENHAARGAEVARSLVESDATLAAAGLDVDRLARVIASHSAKGQPQPDLCCTILKDADLLDCIGAMSIAMHIAKLDGEAPDFWRKICEVLLGREMEFCRTHRALLRTTAAAAILDQKERFIRRFAAQLQREMRATSKSKARPAEDCLAASRSDP